MKQVSLIISVYKDVESLSVILEALKFQTYKGFEIVISEDGEYEGMKNYLQNSLHQNDILHLTQPDIGWRKNKALNNAIRKSKGDYLIFIDGDCVPNHKFIENHLCFSSRKAIVAGRRVKLGPGYTAIFKNNIQDLLRLEKKVVSDYFGMKKDGAKFYEEGVYVNPNSWLGKVLSRRKFRTLKGCNMSFHKQDIELINGFDEDYKSPAVGEDIDLIWRFEAAGFTFRSAKNFAIQYHLQHKENWMDSSINEKIMREKMKKHDYVCKNGILKT